MRLWPATFAYCSGQLCFACFDFIIIVMLALFLYSSSSSSSCISSPRLFRSLVFSALSAVVVFRENGRTTIDCPFDSILNSDTFPQLQSIRICACRFPHVSKLFSLHFVQSARFLFRFLSSAAAFFFASFISLSRSFIEVLLNLNLFIFV